MKKIWVYLLGVLTGIVITIIALAVIGAAINSKDESGTKRIRGMDFFEKPGDMVEAASVKVFQSLDDGIALANCKGDDPYDLDLYGEPIVMLYNEEGTPYYDNQIVKSPKGKCFRQVGIYRYSSRMGDRIVPIVMLLDK